LCRYTKAPLDARIEVVGDEGRHFLDSKVTVVMNKPPGRDCWMVLATSSNAF